MAELAEALSLPIGTVKTRMRTARKRLETLIADLAEVPSLEQSTITRLDQWAVNLRQQMG